MLDKEVFKKGIAYLKACYINWQFDLTNNMMLDVWYRKFSKLNENQFKIMIENYTDNNSYPPQSPNDLLEEIKKVYKSVEMNPDQAWNYVLELKRTYSFHYNQEKIYQLLEDKPVLKKVVEEMESQLVDLKTSDVVNVSREFKKVYASYLESHVNDKVDTLLLIGSSAKQKLLN